MPVTNAATTLIAGCVVSCLAVDLRLESSGLNCTTVSRLEGAAGNHETTKEWRQAASVEIRWSKFVGPDSSVEIRWSTSVQRSQANDVVDVRIMKTIKGRGEESLEHVWAGPGSDAVVVEPQAEPRRRQAPVQKPSWGSCDGAMTSRTCITCTGFRTKTKSVDSNYASTAHERVWLSWFAAAVCCHNSVRFSCRIIRLE